jgi:hypothetical protein
VVTCTSLFVVRHDLDLRVLTLKRDLESHHRSTRSTRTSFIHPSSPTWDEHIHLTISTRIQPTHNSVRGYIILDQRIGKTVNRSEDEDNRPFILRGDHPLAIIFTRHHSRSFWVLKSTFIDSSAKRESITFRTSIRTITGAVRAQKEMILILSLLLFASESC